MTVVLIDNYDSFTWNLYQYVCMEGADVQVFRNDQITIDELEKLNPSHVIISPGPGHPETDAGISQEVIKAFSGKVPVMGVCMGEQCIFSVFGGKVTYAGEIVHGKTSIVSHDGKGLFSGIPQGVAVMRYHSLAGSRISVPDCLEVTSRTENDIIMGVRHKEYTVEGVQFHPESILTEDGHSLIRNFLALKGGKWANEKASAGGSSILERIYAKRKEDIDAIQKVPGRTREDLEKSIALGLAPKLVSFADRLKRSKGTMTLLAEVKRASPSKGPIGMDIHAPTQAKTYAEAGASAISVLCEPHWFKGSIEDLRQVRLAVDSVEDRPAVLLKDFVFDEYQILEARLAGADTVLLIVKMLEQSLLERLYKFSQSLGMEPLVEVSNGPEMERAIALGSKVIGVNNRDLHSFHVDLGVTSSLVSQVPQGTILAALSGISSRAEVDKYAADGVKGILVGESLMRAPNPQQLIKELIE
uniref:Multifunctional tryptophan biosynthesis protein n=1 Tax=Blastobotrys adeninivorans TaxID=409370 RepID=A0A060TB89_BLAAD